MEPRLDEGAFEAQRNQPRSFIENRDLDPFSALEDIVMEKVFNNHIRMMPPTLEVLDTLDSARGLEIYQERFADMGNFIFTFAGNTVILFKTKE